MMPHWLHRAVKVCGGCGELLPFSLTSLRVRNFFKGYREIVGNSPKSTTKYSFLRRCGGLFADVINRVKWEGQYDN